MYAPAAAEGTGGLPPLDDRALADDLADALAQDQFFLLYQPYVDLRTDRVVGVEALVRWSHPRYGVLEPSTFIGVAERSDAIVDLDSWVIAETCRQGRRWLDRGLPPLRLSVNLASRDLADPRFFDTVQATLSDTGLDPAVLELEITERVVLDDRGPARETIERLRRLGVRFTIDDFGTGRSSLSRIGSFPVSTIKIDESFIQVLGPDDEKDSLVSAIVSMADRLGLACVAEGVETSLQSRVLLQRGCTTAQGYYFSPPLRPDDVETMVREASASTGPGDAAGDPGDGVGPA
jgi:EAL domain-containing protein (putative c-di-GMP-specific phosphodiesterase class I)